MCRVSLRNVLVAFVWWSLAAFGAASCYANMLHADAETMSGIVVTPFRTEFPIWFAAAGVMSVFGRMQRALCFGIVPLVVVAAQCVLKLTDIILATRQ